MYRRGLGDDFNEGARQMWLRLDRKGWSLDDLVARTGIKKPALHRYLYGDRRPERVPAAAIQRILKIDQALFDTPPAAEFVTPAIQEETARLAKAAESGTTLPNDRPSKAG